MKMKKVFVLLLSLFAAFGCKNSEEPAAKFFLSTNTLQFDSRGGNVSIMLTSDNRWTASMEEGVDWVALSLMGGPTGRANIMVEVSENEIGAARSMSIGFSSIDGTQTLIITQSISPIVVGDTPVEMVYSGETRRLSVSSSIPAWSAAIVSENSDWCSAAKDGEDGVNITTTLNEGAQREATLRITAGEFHKDVTVTQGEYQLPYGDREIVRLQEATIGGGVEIILMGDGFTAADMGRETGKYVRVMREAMEHLFSVYPYNAYREYFNIWMVGAVSNEEGMSIGTPRNVVDTKFGCMWEGEHSTTIRCNSLTVQNYALAVANDLRKNLEDVTVILPINYDVYAGTCLMDKTTLFSIAQCPTGPTFQGVVVHEGGGHGFAMLADEYVDIPDTELWGNMRKEVEDFKAAGRFANIDLHGDIAQTTWAGFAGNPKYPMVGTYEGAYLYGKGVWRPEQVSCMDDNRLYFNAPSRWEIVRMIMKKSGVDDNYTIEKFMADDVVPAVPERTRVADRDFVPLGTPVFF